MIKRLKKQPLTAKPSTPAFSLSPLQIECRAILDRITAGCSANETVLDVANLTGITSEQDIIDAFMFGADFHLSTGREPVDRVYRMSASYKNYKGYKLPWTETYGERPQVFYKHKNLLVAVVYCFLTLCLRTDQKLWLPDQEPPAIVKSSRLKRVKRATR